MNSKRLSKIEQYYHAALEASPATRSELLTDLCGDDAEIRTEVEALLAFAEKESSLIDKPPIDVAAEIFQGKKKRSEMIGTKFGHHKILSHLGTGGMGEVFLAEDTELGRQIAIKFIKTEFASDPHQLNRFLREAKTASSLNHPNIVTVYEIGKNDDTRFIATEYIEGITLRKLMSENSFSLNETLKIISQVATALQAAHKAGIVHRDVKPENIMVRADNLVKVLDFGLAKLGEREIVRRERNEKQSLSSDLSATASPDLTSPGLMMGTVSYMSPEQARIETIDKRSDIWSIGVLLYEMCSGRKPFRGETTEEKIDSILDSEPKPLGDNIPFELKQIIERALQKDVGKRYQDTQHLLQDISDLQRESSGGDDLFDKSFSAGSKHITSPNESRVSSPSNLLTGSEKTSEKIQISSSAEFVFNEVKKRKVFSGGVIASFILAILVGGYFYTMTNSEIDNSVAVLPFVNETGDPDLEYLSEGISESLINSLSQLSDVKVIAKNSSFQFKGKEANLEEIVRKLNVNFILRGRIVQNGDEFQIIPELINSSDKTKLWGENYSRKLPDVLNVETEISQRIADRMRLHLTNNEQKQLVKGKKTNPKAYELLLKGRFYQSKSGDENSKKALEYYNRALAIDPNYANAHAAISDTYVYLGVNSYLDPKEAFPKAKSAAQKALELNENLAEVRYTLAKIKTTEWNWTGAEREYERATELNPNLASVYGGYAFFLSTQGRHEEAITLIKKKRELDPLTKYIYPDFAFLYYLARQYDLAEEQYENGRELNPNSVGILNGLGFMAAARRDYPKAIYYYQKTLNEVGGKHTGIKCYLGFAFARSGKLNEARAILKDLETGEEYVSPVELAMLYIGLGENDNAIASLQKGYAEHDSQMQFLGVEPHFDDLRGDSRFIDLMKRVGLSPDNYQ